MANKEIDLGFLDENSQDVVQLVTNKMKPRGVSQNYITVEKGDNTRYIQIIRKTASMPPVDLNSAEQIADRVEWFFNLCEECDTKPTVSGIASALGCSRQTLWNYVNDNTRKNSKQAAIIKVVYSMLEQLWEMWMVNGKINPVSGIFLGKNNFGYRDQQDVVVTPNNPLGDMANTEDIKNKYLEDNRGIIDIDEDD